MDKPLWPFGAADYKKPVFAPLIEVTIENRLTFVEPATLTGNATLNITVDPEITPGAILVLKVKTTGTETLTLGAGIEAPVIQGVAGKTKCQSFFYDGFNVIASGAPVQID